MTKDTVIPEGTREKDGMGIIDQIVQITTSTENCATCKHFSADGSFSEWTACQLKALFKTAPQWGGWLAIDSPRIPPGVPGETVCNYWEYCGGLCRKNQYTNKAGIVMVWTDRQRDRL